MDKPLRDREKARWRALIQTITEQQVMEGTVARQSLWKRNKATLWYYRPTEKKYDVPIFLIYSLVNKPTILDLMPQTSLINAFVNSGYEVYLIDFGISGYEDHDMTIDDYILKYIKPSVQIALEYSNSSEISIMGFCLGGTLAAMYATIAAEPIKNLILFVTPIDFSYMPKFDLLHKALQENKIDIFPFVDALGLIPAGFMEFGTRLITSPLYISPYLSLLNRAHDPLYVEKWALFNQWIKEHIPFPGVALKQLIDGLLIENKLVKGSYMIGGKAARLDEIRANLLVIASMNDELVPIEQAYPIVEIVQSEDKKFIAMPNGHTGLATGNGLPSDFFDWLSIRSKDRGGM